MPQVMLRDALEARTVSGEDEERLLGMVRKGNLYRSFLEQMERELTYAFGGCTRIEGATGNYCNERGDQETEPVAVLYSDTHLVPSSDRGSLGVYMDILREAAYKALNEEKIMVTFHRVYWSD